MNSLIANSPWWAIDHSMSSWVAEFVYSGKELDVDVSYNRSYEIDENGMASISVSGILMKAVPGYLRLCGVDATGYSDIADQVSRAGNDPAVKSIRLMINSPGGTVNGVGEAAEAIYEARKKKKIVAYIEGCGASAAYMLASQANQIIAEKNSIVGSVGVYSYMYDTSEMANKAGVKAIVFASGKHKGVGIPGSPISEEQKIPYQSIVDGMADNFIEIVSRGRSMPEDKVREIATGQSWIAKEAKALGIVDEVVTTLNEIVLGDKIMSEQSTELIEPVAAVVPEDEDKKKTDPEEEEEKEEQKSEDVEDKDEEDKEDEEDEKASLTRLSELRAAFPDNPNFVLDQFALGNNVQAAKAAMYDMRKTDGEPPIASSTHNGTQGNDFLSMARQRAADEKISVTDAMKKLRAENKEAHEAFALRK